MGELDEIPEEVVMVPEEKVNLAYYQYEIPESINEESVLMEDNALEIMEFNEEISKLTKFLRQLISRQRDEV